ncbi:Hoc-like capsid decoration protein [Klebsiella phage Metamorpho]|nr:Hoc-like capsid decoration protein [Klebsiella phage Metamorpho]
MADKWTTVHPIPWRDTSFTYLPYWLFDIIVAEHKAGRDWRDYSGKYDFEFATLVEAFNAYDDITVIESRNGNMHDLIDFTKLTLTGKSVTLKVGDPDLVSSALFSCDPHKRLLDIVMTDDGSGHAKVVKDTIPVVSAVSAGVTKITGTIDGVTAEATVTVTA